MCHVQKFREYILGTSRIARLDSKHEHIRQTLLDAAGDSPTSLKGLQQRHTGQTMKPPRRKRIGRLQMNGQPKLFGGSLEEYLETTNQEIPLIMKSCIRVINLYGGFNKHFSFLNPSVIISVLKEFCRLKVKNCPHNSMETYRVLC
jgi:SLIT-ROBO Rho GTPase activating protein